MLERLPNIDMPLLEGGTKPTRYGGAAVGMCLHDIALDSGGFFSKWLPGASGAGALGWANNGRDGALM